MGQDCCSANDSKQNEMMTNVENIDKQNAQGNKSMISSRQENDISDIGKNNVSCPDHSRMIATLGDYSLSQANNNQEGTVIQQKETDKMFDLAESAQICYNKLGSFQSYNDNQNLIDGNDGKLLGPFVFDDESTYFGQIDKQNYRHGYGKLITKTGSIYEGEFRDNWFNGKGRLIQNTGDYLIALFKNGLVEGQGETYNQDGRQIMKAIWKNNQLNGLGEEWAFDENKYYKQYKGEYKNDMKNGRGIFYWPDGSFYDGYFTENDMNIFGKYTWPNNKTWIGEWSNNAINGWGQMKWPDGKVFFGKYENDLKNGYGEMKQATGSVIKSYWIKNKNNLSVSYIIKSDGKVLRREYDSKNQKVEQEIDITDVPKDFGKEMVGINLETLKQNFNMIDLEYD